MFYQQADVDYMANPMNLVGFQGFHVPLDLKIYFLIYSTYIYLFYAGIMS